MILQLSAFARLPRDRIAEADERTCGFGERFTSWVTLIAGSPQG